ncbi:unnamed protein product [Amaranthus hypochondriacus]
MANQITMVVFIISMICAVESLEISLNPVSSPESDVSSNPNPSLDSPLLSCFAKLSYDCASNIMGNEMLFTTHLHVKCCQQLIEMGQNCYNMILKDMMEEFHNQNAMQMLERSEHLWSLCVASISGVDTSSPPMDVGDEKLFPFIYALKPAVEIGMLGWHLLHH